MDGKEPVRILCLDGGGSKGLLSLAILKELMAQISRRYCNISKLRPCDHFDLICGTGTGGLIAIMVGRLQLDIDTAIQCYTEIQRVITVSLCKSDLERSIEKVLSKVARDDPLFEDNEVGRISTFCRTLVLAIRPDGLRNAAVLIRSYGTKDQDPFQAKISQVVYAILAAPKILEPLNINGIFYAEANNWNNPIEEAMKEASDMWHKQRISFISIGAGIEDTQPPSQQRSSLTQILFGQARMESPDSKLFKWDFELSEISERIHEEVRSGWGMYAREGWQYIRLNIRQGISTVRQEKWEESMPAFVKEYMESFEIQQEIKGKLLDIYVTGQMQ